MVEKRRFPRPAGYLDSPNREVLEYRYERYLFLKLTDYRTGETKQLRRACTTQGWRCYQPWEVSTEERMDLGKEIHARGHWAPRTIADFLCLDYDNLKAFLGMD